MSWAKEFLQWCDEHEIKIPARDEEGLLEIQFFIANNKELESIHPHIIHLKSLKKVSLRKNLLKDLPPLPSGITYLDLGDNFFEEIPESLKELKDLDHLFIQSSMLESIPSWISDLKKLWFLDLTRNKISSIQELEGHQSLTILNIAENRISDIAPIYSMASLEAVNLSNNKVKVFDKRIRKMKNLRFFIAYQNPFQEYDELFLLDQRTKTLIRSNRYAPKEGWIAKFAYFMRKYPLCSSILARILIRR